MRLNALVVEPVIGNVSCNGQ